MKNSLFFKLKFFLTLFCVMNFLFLILKAENHSAQEQYDSLQQKIIQLNRQLKTASSPKEKDLLVQTLKPLYLKRYFLIQTLKKMTFNPGTTEKTPLEPQPQHPKKGLDSRAHLITNNHLFANMGLSARSDQQCKNPKTDEQCMVCNCYNEAAFEKMDGQVEVAKVVLNRLLSGAFPRSSKRSNSLCGVIFDPLQFSWTNSQKTRRSVPQNHSCFQAVQIAIKEKTEKPTIGKTHYHADYVWPSWAPYCTGRKQIGAHIFYSTCNKANGPVNLAISNLTGKSS